MKEKQLQQILQQQYGDVPPQTHRAFMDALAPGKEERAVKQRKMMLTPALAFVLVLMLTTTAVAATSQVLEWYYANRFINVQPDERDAILSHVKLPIAQSCSENADFDAVIQEVSWVSESKRLIVALNVAPKDAEAMELHHMLSLDTDGSYVGGDAPLGTEDGEDRGDHWLWTGKGFGPVRDMMTDPSKPLYLVDVDMSASPGDAGRMQSLDAYDAGNGSVQFILEYDLQDIAHDADTAGLTISYYTVAYTEDDAALYNTGRQYHWIKLTADLNAGQP